MPRQPGKLSPKEQLRLYLQDLELEDLDRLIRRLGRAPRSSPEMEPKKEDPAMAKYLTHKDFMPAIREKLLELRTQHGETIFKQSGALRVGAARDAYVAWYMAERRETFASRTSEKSYDEEYYVRQGLSLARIVEQRDRQTRTNPSPATEAAYAHGERVAASDTAAATHAVEAAHHTAGTTPPAHGVGHAHHAA